MLVFHLSGLLIISKVDDSVAVTCITYKTSIECISNIEQLVDVINYFFFFFRSFVRIKIYKYSSTID